MHPGVSIHVGESSPCSEQITNTFRAVLSSPLSFWENGNKSFPCTTLSASQNRGNVTSPSCQATISEQRVSGKGEECCRGHCPCWISSLVVTRAWFQCLSIWWFSLLTRNIFSILYFYTIAQSPEQLETKQLQSYKNAKCFLVHFNDNFLICVMLITECNHLLSNTTYLGEKCIGLFLSLSVWSWFYTKSRGSLRAGLKTQSIKLYSNV